MLFIEWPHYPFFGQVDDKFHGQGKFTYANGRVFKGEYYEDKRHGQGLMTYPDGRSLQG